MAQTIKLKRSSVSGNTPGTSDLELGEVAINTYDGKMFIKKNDGSDSIVEIGGTSGTVTEAFKTIAISGQSSVVADSATDTLTLVAGSNMTITTNASGDTITFASSGGGGTQNVFTTFAVSGQSSVVADSTTDTLTLVAGSGITLSTDNSADSITIAATASAITVQDEGSALSTSATTLNFVGAGVTATGTGATKTITIPGTGTVSEAFKTIAVSGQSNVVADGATDTLTLAAGSGMTITTNASNDTITFASSGGSGSQNVFSNIAVSGQGTVQADATTDTLTVVAGTGISLTTDTSADSLTITNTGSVNVANAAASIKEFKYDISSSTTTITGSDANSNTLAYEAGAIQVFLNGILLDPATDYTASNGTSVVLTDAAVNGDDVQIVSFNRKIVTANVGIDTFTGNGSTTAYTLSNDPVNENNTRVHIDGVYQEKAAYSVSGTTLTFSAAPPNGSSIEVEVGFTQAEIGSTLDFADNAILRIGTGNDLQILHDGSNSIIKDTGTGDLQIAASTLEVKNAAINETMIKAIQDGAVELYHDNNKKLETVTGGVTITGTVTATTFSGDLSGTINTATTGTTQSASDNSTKLATTAYVTTALSNLVDSAPGTLNTLNELAAALGDDANFSTTITNSLATKVGLTATTGAATIPAGTTGQRPGSPAAGQFRYNSTLSQFEGYTSSWGAIGGGGTNTFTTDTLTTSGSATVTLSQAVASPNDCIVHIDGIYQTPTDAYTVSGTTLTFTATPASGRKVVVYSIKAGVSGNNLNTQTFSGNGSATSFTMNVNPINENNTIVHIDGVYQQKTSYSTSGTTLSFSAAPANGTTIEVATFTQTEINVPVNDTIDTVHIKDDAVTSAKLGGNLVTPGTLDVNGAEFILDADADTSLTADTDDQIDIKIGGTDQIKLIDGAILPVTTNDIDLGSTSLEFKNAYFDGTVTSDSFIGPLTGNVTGNVSGTAATVTGAAQTNITSVGTLTGLTTTGNLIGTTAAFSDTVTIDAADGDADEAYVFAVRSQEATAGRNYGMWVRAGSNSSDESFSVRNFDNSSMYFKIRGDGNVGIGNTSPNRQLSLKHASQAEIGFKTGSVSNGAVIYYNDSENQLLLRAQESGENIAFQTGGTTERMRIDGSGNVGIGTTAVNDPGFWYDATNDYLAISHWANPPTPAAMLHLSDNSNNLDVPQIRIEGRENPGGQSLLAQDLSQPEPSHLCLVQSTKSVRSLHSEMETVPLQTALVLADSLTVIARLQFLREQLMHLSALPYIS
ncbi:MAG: beta strand repeat-containing protein [Akkermansiaceae bacterium]